MNVPAHRWQAGPPDGSYGEAASFHNKSLSMHRWANWIAGFSGKFARSAIAQYLPATRLSANSGNGGYVVLDPFAGVGTTLIEANRLGLDCIGFEINPFAALVCRVKLGAVDICLGEFQDSVRNYVGVMKDIQGREPQSSPPAGFKSRIPFFSPAVEHKVLLTLDYMNDLPPQIKDLFRVAFASVMVDFSNYSYEPSLSTRTAAGKALVCDAEVAQILAAKLRNMVEDIAEFQEEAALRQSQGAQESDSPTYRLHECSFFDAESCMEDASVDLIVTSPPYMNNYHYVRNSRPQMFWSGLVQSSSELKPLETGNFGKFWQTVRGDEPIALTPQLPQLEAEISEIRDTNRDRGVYGGNGWANYVAAYMNDMDQFCRLLNGVLKPGGTAVVVVGNSIVQGREIKVEEWLCDIAERHGLSVLNAVQLRERVGSSIINSGARLQSRKKSALYDAAVALRRPASSGAETAGPID